jgi:integrase
VAEAAQEQGHPQRAEPPQGATEAPAGARYQVRSYRRAIVKACEKAGLPRWHPHQLRHSAATQLRKEFGVEVARVILGHRSLAATEVCSELNRDRAVAVMQAVG